VDSVLVPQQPRLLHADLHLSRRLEGAEGRSNAELVAARARVHPDSGAKWIRIGGAWAMFDGVGSPCTQTFGLGLFDDVTDADLDSIEAFFLDRGADVFHEVSPLAAPELVGQLTARGYVPIELSNVLVREIGRNRGPDLQEPTSLVVRIADGSEAGGWARVAARGWSDVAPGLEDYMLDLGEVLAARGDTVCFVAESDGEPMAAGALCIQEGVALLAGASTLPAWRRRGAQLALLRSRLEHAAERGCDIAMVVTQPGSASQRNAERRGFRVAYTRIKWRLEPPGRLG
jgi:GNAT superfamily N-acetyltransferase